VAAFRADLARARERLTRPVERRSLAEISGAFADFMRLDARAFAALRAGRTAEVRRLFLGPEITNFERAAAGAQRLATYEEAHAALQERTFRSARRDALRYLIGASIIAGVLVAILLGTANDLARRAEDALGQSGT
jgi:hypothetical protein